MFAGTHSAVHSAQGPINSIVCTGEILTFRTCASKGYIILKFEGGVIGVSDFVMLLA
jgi:hypothetical protein